LNIFVFERMISGKVWLAAHRISLVVAVIVFDESHWKETVSLEELLHFVFERTISKMVSRAVGFS
jgi:hypothetical protein